MVPCPSSGEQWSLQAAGSRSASASRAKWSAASSEAGIGEGIWKTRMGETMELLPHTSPHTHSRAGEPGRWEAFSLHRQDPPSPNSINDSYSRGWSPIVSHDAPFPHVTCVSSSRSQTPTHKDFIRDFDVSHCGTYERQREIERSLSLAWYKKPFC